jgi:hypothetical protein
MICDRCGNQMTIRRYGGFILLKALAPPLVEASRQDPM